MLYNFYDNDRKKVSDDCHTKKIGNKNIPRNRKVLLRNKKKTKHDN